MEKLYATLLRTLFVPAPGGGFFKALKDRFWLLFMLLSGCSMVLISPQATAQQWNNDYFQASFKASETWGAHVEIKLQFQSGDGGEHYIDNGDGDSDDSRISFMTSTGDRTFAYLYPDRNEDGNDIRLVVSGAGENFKSYKRENSSGSSVTIRIYFTNDQVDDITGVKLHVNKWNINNGGDDHNINVPRNFTIPRFQNLRITGHKYMIDGKASIAWESDKNALTDISRTALQFHNGTNWQNVDYSNKGSAGGLLPDDWGGDIDAKLTTNIAKKFRLHQLTWVNGVPSMELSSDEYTLPALTHPENIEVEYNSETDKVDITWKVPQAGSDLGGVNDVAMYGFKLRRSRGDDVTEDYEDLGNLPDYQVDKTTYTYSDEPHAGATYWIARDIPDEEAYGGEWGWGASQYVRFTAEHAAFDTESDLQLSLTDDNTARLSWTADGIWTSGTSFIITRVNKSSGITTEISLNKEDYYKEEYVDDLIIPCNEYFYTLQIKPAPGLGFKEHSPYQTENAIMPVEIGTISQLSVSKGYFPDRVELRWRTEGGFDSYLVSRKKYGASDEEYVQIASIEGGGATTEILADDEKATPGVYYEYKVVGAVNCNDTTRYSLDTLYAIGFRSPTGSIYGRVTYENGQPVRDVAVRLENQDAQISGQSVYLNGEAGSYLKLDSLFSPFANLAFTIEAWIRPDEAAPKDQVLFSREGQYELGFDDMGQLYFEYLGTRVTADYENVNGGFIHVAGIHEEDFLGIMLDDSLMAEATLAFNPSNVDNTPVYIGCRAGIGSSAGEKRFKGYIDEMRAWNRALSPEEIARDYTRLLAGDEPGLVAYWRFDETITDQFYDLSHEGEEYHRNDGLMDAAQVQRSSVIPSPGQLALKAYTDSTGNYAITGIPYTGSSGTTYTVVPLLGTHQFDPVSVNRLLSADSPTFTVDFTDKSSFPVSGYVYYQNSTVPVEGVQFKIDGQYALQGNGELFQTNASGKFMISVPVGTHEVRAVKNNHVFVNDGKITDRFGNNLNYQGPVSERILRDSTTIRFSGRVAGGTIQEAHPLGHSLSSNNLGKELKLVLKLSNDAYRLYDDGDIETNDDRLVKTVDHLLPANVSDPSEVHQTKVVTEANQIVIYPDPETGEFVADLIPEKFNVGPVEATGWGDLLEGSPMALDLTNRFLTDSVIYNYTDSLLSADGDWVYTHYSDTAYANYTYQFIKRVTPSVSFEQLDRSEKKMAFFGDSTYRYELIDGTADTISLIDHSGTGREQYQLGYPVFTKGVDYKYRVSAFEEYPFYESVRQDGTPVIAQEQDKAVIDRVPTQDGAVSIYNNIRSGATGTDTLSLDSTGTAIYGFVAGDPQTIAPGLKDLSLTIRFGEATDVNWNWLGSPQLQAFVLGSRKTGNDFVTAGPNKMLAVLRDPPGSQSYSFLESGSTISSSTTYTGTVDYEKAGEVIGHFGTNIVIWAGVGAGTISKTEVANDAGLSASLETHYTHNDTKVTTTTLTSRYQTSSDPNFVGAPGDVFVGYSTNITYGRSENLTIIHRDALQVEDVVLWGLDENSPYLIVQRGGLAFGEKFGTLFAYSQQHIENILLPNLEEVRNTLLLPPSTSPAAAQQAANSNQEPVYVSKLTAEDPNFGKSNNDEVFAQIPESDVNDGPSYRIYFPDGSDYRTDTISTLNQYIQHWVNELAENEKQKLESELEQNYSFQAGSPVAYSETTSKSHTKSNSFNIIVSGSVFGETGAQISGVGATVKFSENLGTQQGGSFDETSDSTWSQGFELISGGVGEYLSVDVNRAEDEGFVFRTKGGQTECPYEGERLTKYYQPGAVLDQPTIQMDKPSLSVDEPVMNDVPSTQKASYTLHLQNASDAEWDTEYTLTYADIDSVKGATISVDGVSIANGRVFPIKYGQTITKVLTITKGPEAMDYDNIPIILHSVCQYDPTGYAELIADTVLVSAHFVPSCSNVSIKSPADNWVLNSASPVNQQGRRYVPVTLDEFDISNNLFDRIELQYKPAASSEWITVMKFYADEEKFAEAQGEKAMITNPGEINYNLEMDDAAFNDQQYDIRALAVCRLGPGEEINTPSNVVSGIKDTYTPRLFGSAQPANGVLGVGDEVRLNFNETIAAGLLTYPDFQVTGIRNGSQGDHSVSVRLDGQDDYLATEFDKNLSGKTITVEMWALPDSQGGGTLFSHGTVNESLELAFTGDDHLEVTVGEKTLKSESALNYNPGEWAHVALVYRAADSTVSAFYNFTEVIHQAPAPGYSGSGVFNFGRSIGKQGDFFAGDMHEARLWTKALSGTRLQTNSLRRLSGAENALMAYYPMTEAKGSIAFDKAHGANASLLGDWSTPPGRAIAFEGDGYVKMSTGTAPVTADMDYTIELWFKGEPGQSDVALASNGRGDGLDNGGSRQLFFLGFEEGLLTFRNNGFSIQAEGDYLDDDWHHVALAVNRRSGMAQLFIDGAMKRYFDARNLGGIAAPYAYLGARGWYDEADGANVQFDRHFRGKIDEFRIWNTYLGEAMISNYNNVRLKGDELGLMLYYPFERYFEFQNNQELGFTLEDMKVQDDPATVIPEAEAVQALEDEDKAPIKGRGPVENLQFDYVVNDDGLIIDLQEPRQAIDKAIVTFRVANVRDENGNALESPVTWTAYIDRNQLSWSNDVVELTKKLQAPLEFESYILNSGGSVQHFTLDNLPPWLNASPAEGTVEPKAEQKVTFTVNQGLNAGTYDEIIYLRNDNDETRALSVNLKVRGDEPDWNVDPADFKYNMTVYGKLRIKGVFSNSEEDLLAAFKDGVCVGVTHNAYYAGNDLWYAFLTVYGNSVAYDDLEFRIWEANTDRTYLATPDAQVTFKSDTVIGIPRDPVVFNGEEMEFQQLNLEKGWNWISFNLGNPGLNDVGATLGNGQWQPGDIVKNEELGFNQFSMSSGWVGYLEGFNNESLFMLKTEKAQTLSISGVPLDLSKMPIPLRGGRWNYISYLPREIMTVREALAGYEASENDVIKSQTGFAMYDSMNGWVGNLTYMEPGKGYMLYRSETTNDTLYYPNLGGSLSGIFGKARDANNREAISGNLNELETPVQNNYSFAENMTVVARLPEEFDEEYWDQVLAYAGGELRAKARLVENPVSGQKSFFANIAGEEEEPVYFEVERAGRVVARSSTTITYRPNMSLGTLKAPLVIDLERDENTLKAWPNPFWNEVNIGAELTEAKAANVNKVQISIYDVRGGLMFRDEVRVDGDRFVTQWNGRNMAGQECPQGVYFVHLMIGGERQVKKIIKTD